MEQRMDLTRVPVDIGTQSSSENPPEPGMISRAMANVYQRMDADTKRFGLAVLTSVALPTFVQLAFHNVLLTIVVLTIPFLGWGIRVVPKYHNGLMSLLWVRRTRIGFFEGLVWVPWFLGAKIEFYDTRKRQLDIPKEDNWTTDSMHLVYDIVLNFGITQIADDDFWKNFFRFFQCLFKRSHNADSLYYFSDQIDLSSATVIMVSLAADLTIKAVNSRGYAEIFQQQADGRPRLRENTIQEQVIKELNHELSDMGLTVYKFNLKDVDFHEDSASVLQEKFLAQVRGDARKVLYDIIVEVAKTLVDAGPGVSDTAIRIETVEAMKKAADGEGVIGLLLQSLVAEKSLSLRQ